MKTRDDDGITNATFLKKIGRRIARCWGPPRKSDKRVANKGTRKIK